MNKPKRAEVALVWLMAMAGATHAAEFTVNGAILFGDLSNPTVFDQYNVTLPLSVGRGVQHASEGREDFHAQANSLADRFGLHAHAYNQIIHQVSGDFGYAQYWSTAFAESTFHDFTINGPVGAGPVQTAINFHLSGEQDLASYAPTFGAGSTVNSGVYFSVHVTGAGADFGADYGSSNLHYSSGIPSAPYQTSMLVGFKGNMVAKTKTLTLPVNVPLKIDLQLNANAYLLADFADSFNTAANTDFSGTLTFATDRPVFDLPSGYTANSIEAAVVANAFSAPVPEPGTAALWALGLALVCMQRRAKR